MLLLKKVIRFLYSKFKEKMSIFFDIGIGLIYWVIERYRIKVCFEDFKLGNILDKYFYYLGFL